MYTLTINNVEYGWLIGSFSETDNINDRSTCSFMVDSTVTLTVGMEVIVENGAMRVFGGTIDSLKRRTPQGTNLKRYSLTCVDYNQLADKRRVAATYTNQTVSYIVNDIITNYLAAEGVTAGTIPTGPVITEAVFDYRKASECLDFIKTTTGLNWNIDYNKALQIFYREDYIDIGFTDTLANFYDAEYEETRDEYRNSQYIRGGKDTTGTITKEAMTPKPDSITRTFLSRYPIATKPTVYVDDVAVVDGDVGINGLDTGMKWYWNKGERTIAHSTDEAVLTDANTLTMTYIGLVDLLVKADNPPGKAVRQVVESGTSGIYESIENVPQINNQTAAMNYAKGLLQKYADIPKKVYIRTQEFRQAGKLIPIMINSLGIMGDYLIDNVSIGEESGQMFYKISCLSGDSLGSWVEFFRKMQDSGQKYTIRDNEVLVLLVELSEINLWAELVIPTVYTCPIPGATQYPRSTLYPC